MSADQRIVSHAHVKVSPAQSGEGVATTVGLTEISSRAAPVHASERKRQRVPQTPHSHAAAAIANAQLACTECGPTGSSE